MALVKIPAEGRTIEDPAAIRQFLGVHGIDYERVAEPPGVATAAPDALLAAYAPEIDGLKARGGYRTADVIDVTPATPGLDAMRASIPNIGTTRTRSD
jgi:1,2-dihydroxy-3-keto-5-methylthiopentene dioxygenase